MHEAAQEGSRNFKRTTGIATTGRRSTGVAQPLIQLEPTTAQRRHLPTETLLHPSHALGPHLATRPAAVHGVLQGHPRVSTARRKHYDTQRTHAPKEQSQDLRRRAAAALESASAFPDTWTSSRGPTPSGHAFANLVAEVPQDPSQDLRRRIPRKISVGGSMKNG